LADASEELCNRVLSYASHSDGRPNRVSLNESGYYGGLTFGWKVVHV
jgi:hypothetical protein